MDSDKTIKSDHHHHGDHGHHHHHHHHHHHGHHHHHSGDNIGLAFLLNLVFSIIEIIGGYLTGSYAILADAVHDLGDTATIGVSWLLEKKSKKSADNRYSYGYARYSLLASVITAVVLLISSAFIIISAIPKLLDPSAPNTLGVLGLAVLGVAVNGYAFIKLSGDKSHNSKMLKWHLFEDAAGWVIVLLGGIVMHFTGWYIIDPILAILLATFISYNVIKGLIDVIRIFLQKTPVDLDRETFKKEILEIENVVDVHDIHAWSLDHENIILTCHVVIKNKDDVLTIKKEVKNKLASLGHIHSTIEVEFEGEDCHQDC